MYGFEPLTRALSFYEEEFIMTVAIGILCGIIGLFIGVFSVRFLNSFVPRGVLYINTKDPSKDLYRLEIEDLDDLERANRILFYIQRDEPKVLGRRPRE